MDYKYLETAIGVKTENLMVRLTLSEKRQLFSEAQKLGISGSAFVRLLLVNWMNSIKSERG
uniref:Uncharacterized protein n=1 Tax=viral metagenome TaxID=1070528 RepID=A0A6M3IXR3_9ZZZZ